MPYRSRTLLPLLAAAMLCGSVAQAQNVFTLQVNPSSANQTSLKAGDVFKLDVFYTSNGATPIVGYQAAIGFDPKVFDQKRSGDASIFVKNPSSPFDIQSNGSAFANGSTGPRVFTGAESSSATSTFSTTPTLLGTFNLTVLASASSGTSEIRFSDLLATPPANQNRTNLLFDANAASFKPTLQNGVISVQVAAVPETGTLLGLGSLLGIGGLTLRRKRNAC